MSSRANPCSKCTKEFKELRYMICNHGFCTKCLQELSNAARMQSGISNSVTCSICNTQTTIPDSRAGVNEFPRQPHPTSPTSDPEQATFATKLGRQTSGLKLNGTKLLWSHESPPYVWDADFLPDESILYIVSITRKGKVCRELRRLSLSGDEMEDLFPFSGFSHPSGISVNHDIRSVAISDWCLENGSYSASVSVLTQDDDAQWAIANFDLPEMTQRLSLTTSGDVVCTQGNNAMCKVNGKGIKVWDCQLPHGDSNPFITNDNEGAIIVSTPNNSEVRVYASNGKESTAFPKQFVNKPAGVCTDSFGRVYVSNKDGSVRLFTKQGKAVIKLVDKCQPGCVRVYKDKYLLVGTGNGIYLYELM